MTSPRFASSDDTGRTYTLPNIDTPLVSVTTVLNVISKGALMNWSAKLAAERAMESEDTWHAIEQEEGREAARKWISSAAREYTRKRQLLGSAVHHLCENHGDHNDDVLSKHAWFAREMGGDVGRNMKQIEAHYEQYKRFTDECAPRIIEQERTVANIEQGYAGTLDLICEMGGKTYIGDIKTSPRVYETTALQLAAYRHATHMVDGEETVATDLLSRVEGGFVLRLAPRSYQVAFMRVGDEEYQAFLAAMRLKKWVDAGGVIGEEYR